MAGNKRVRFSKFRERKDGVRVKGLRPADKARLSPPDTEQSAMAFSRKAWNTIHTHENRTLMRGYRTDNYLYPGASPYLRAAEELTAEEMDDDG